MGNEEVKKCAICGHESSEGFQNDICPDCNLTYWRCDGCGYLLTAKVPPEICPSCNNKCVFKNVTCYTPECGGPGNVDTRL